MTIKTQTASLTKVLLIILLLASPVMRAEVSVVVHPSAEIDNITAANVVNIFLGKVKTLPNGKLIIPIDQPRDSETRFNFYKKLANKNQNQLNAYWARQVFTGKSQPPSQVNSNEEIRLLISDNPSMIGYIDSDFVDDSLKVILVIP